MILPDVNALFYAFRSDTDDHSPYRQWLDSVVKGSCGLRYGTSGPRQSDSYHHASSDFHASKLALRGIRFLFCRAGTPGSALPSVLQGSLAERTVLEPLVSVFGFGGAGRLGPMRACAEGYIADPGVQQAESGATV